MNNMNYDEDLKLPDVIKIDDITSGKIDAELIYKELERLKVEVNILRNDMTLFIKALATIPENSSQNSYYKLIASRLRTVQNTIHDYCLQYNKLLPIINLSQIKLGNEVEIIPPSAAGGSGTNSIDLNANKSGSVLNIKNGKKNNLLKPGSNNNSKTTNTNKTSTKHGLNPGQPIVL